MFRTTVKIEGMACSMCEAHINDAIRNAFPKAKKVASSHVRAESSFLTEEAPDLSLLQKTIDDTGYHYLSAESTPEEKKGFFARFSKKA